jgi:hypothetical protein
MPFIYGKLPFNSANYILTLPLKLVRSYLLSLTCLKTYEELPLGLHGLKYLLIAHLI